MAFPLPFLVPTRNGKQEASQTPFTHKGVVVKSALSPLGVPLSFPDRPSPFHFPWQLGLCFTPARVKRLLIGSQQSLGPQAWKGGSKPFTEPPLREEGDPHQLRSHSGAAGNGAPSVLGARGGGVCSRCVTG